MRRRRWLAVAALLLVDALLLLPRCGALQCQTADVGIWPHPSKPKPAGRVLVKCDGKLKVTIDADRIGP